MFKLLKEEYNIKNFSSYKEILIFMEKNIKYVDFTVLKNHDEVLASKSGSCHDQVIYLYEELEKIGIHAEIEFFIEINKNKKGGITHSFIHFLMNEKIYWLENAWNDQKGIHIFNSLDDIKSIITKLHRSGEFGNSNIYPNLEWGIFKKEEHKYGESLNKLVNLCLKNKRKN